MFKKKGLTNTTGCPLLIQMFQFQSKNFRIAKKKIENLKEGCIVLKKMKH